MRLFKREYKVTVNGDDWVAPEETLMDESSSHSDLEQPISDHILSAIFWGMIILVSITLFGSFKLGILEHGYLNSLALQNRSLDFLIPPARGIIFDKTGKPLVQNLPSFDLLAVSKEINLDGNSGKDTIDKIAGILNVGSEELQNTISAKTKTDAVFFVANGLTKDQILNVEYLNPKGFYIIPNTKRYYVDGPQFSQIVGYIGKVNKDDLSTDNYYSPTDVVGRLGIEGEYEQYLRGEHGKIFFGDVEDNNESTVTGQNVVLNIDYNLQKELYNDLYGILVEANLPKAAAIIQDPRDGSIKAMVSFPSFDNNSFVNGLSESDFNKIFNNKNRPLFNRAISGLYNPGSTIKPYIGMASLQEHIMSPQDTIQDCVSITIPNPFDKNVSYTFKNWRSEYGPFNLRKAIANSCNIYFFTVGGGFGNVQGLGVDRIDSYLRKGFADKNLGIDLPGEDHGFVPTPQWKEETRGEQWYQGDTYNISIGQGDLLVTPLWLNTYISAIANGGTIYQPRVAQKIVDNNKETIKEFKPEVLGQLPFDTNVIKEVKSDMSETIQSGTATLLKDLPVKAGAKTGTAEVVKGKSINSLFAAFAPFDNPEVAITVLVEGSSSNQGYAIRAANEVLKWYFSQTPGTSGN